MCVGDDYYKEGKKSMKRSWIKKKKNRKEEIVLTVWWLSCESRPVVRNPVEHVKIVLYIGPQLTLLNIFSNIHHDKESTTSKANHNNV